MPSLVGSEMCIRDRETTPLKQSRRPFPRRTLPLTGATTVNSLAVVDRYDLFIYSPRRIKDGDNSPMSSRVDRLHRGPDLRRLHSGQHSFHRDHKSKGFQLILPQRQHTGGGGERSFQPRKAVTAVFHDGPAPEFLHNRRISSSCFSRWRHVTSRCLA